MASINWAALKTAAEIQLEKDSHQQIIALRQSIKQERQSSELNEVTPQQAYDFINNKLDNATTAAETKEAIRTILLKMVPFILE